MAQDAKLWPATHEMKLISPLALDKVEIYKSISPSPLIKGEIYKSISPSPLIKGEGVGG